MRKHLLLLCLLAITLVGCSESEIFYSTQELTEKEIKTRTSGDGIYDVLGYGYDITEDYLGEKSTRLMILNIDSFVKNNKYRFDNPFIGIIDQRCYAGEDARTFLNQIISDSNFNGSVGSLPDKKDKGGILFHYCHKRIQIGLQIFLFIKILICKS